MFVLIMILITANGVTSSTISFADEAACKATMATMAPELNSLKRPDLIYYLHCQPVQ